MPLIPRRIKNRHFLATDIVTLFAASLIAFLVRFEDLSWVREHWRLVSLYVGLTLPLRLFAFHLAGMYRRLWRHASVGELRQIMLAGVLSALIGAGIGLVLLPATGLTRARAPFSVVFIDGLLTTVALAFPRLLARTSRSSRRRRKTDSAKPVLIVGAGDAAKMIVKDLLQASSLEFDPIGYVASPSLGHAVASLPNFSS